MPEFLPDRLEAGTHNVPGIAGLLEGIRFVRRRGVEKIGAYGKSLAGRMIQGLTTIPDVTVYHGDPAIQTGVVSFRVEGKDCQSVAQQLGERGFALRAGLHCAPTAHETAGTLEQGTIRASISAFNTREEILAFLRAVRDLCRS